MIPLVASAASSITKGDTMKKAGIAIGIVAIAGVGIWAYSNYSKKQKIQAASNTYSSGSKEGLAVQYAGLFRASMYSGWFGASEDEKAIYATAIKMHENKVSFKQVADAYRQLYGDELLVKINKLLNPEEQDIFTRALDGKYKPVSNTGMMLTAAKVINPWFNIF